METTVTFNTGEDCNNYLNSIPRSVTFYIHLYSNDGGYIGAIEIGCKDALRICQYAINQQRVIEFMYYQDMTCFITIKSNK